MKTLLKEILSELRRQMNGAVSQTMREMGQSNSLNFGVSLPTIKEIAMRYAPNHELAEELSDKKSREAQISALYIADPEKITAELMERWSNTWENEEIARLSAMLLFYKSSDSLAIAGRWLDSTPLRKVSAMYIIGKNASCIDGAIIRTILAGADTSSIEATYCLREIYHARNEYREEIKEIAKTNAELGWQIESAE